MTKIFLSLLLVLTGYGSWGQNKKLDSLYQELNSHPQQDTLRAYLLVSICYYEYTSDNEKNKRLAGEALALSKKLNYKKGIGMALKYHALYYWVNGNYEQATVYAIEMLKVFEGTSDHLGLSQAYNLLGLINHRGHNFEKAKAYYTKALKIREQAGLTKDVGYSYNSLGALCLDVSKHDEALTYFLKSLEIRKQVNDSDALSQTYGNLAGTYLIKKDYHTSLDYFQKAFDLLKNSTNKYRIADNYSALGEVYIHLKKYNQAEYCLLRSEALAKGMRHKEVLVETYKRLKLLETSRRRFKSAIAYLELKHAYEDSIYTEKKIKQIAEVETRYESKKKDKKIQALEQQDAFQDLRQRYLFSGLCALVVIFLGIFLLQRAHNKKIKSFLDIQKSLNQKLQETDQLKSRFFANISHEFRTPLTLILSPVEEKLSSNHLMESDRESFQLIRRNAKRLLTLINQLLDLSKLEAGKMELHVQKGSVEKFIDEVTISFEALADAKEIHFVKNINPSCFGSCYDADKLEKIISNILSNAFKFTPSGGTVALVVERTAASDDLTIRIADSGSGIAPEDQQHIFTPFYQSKYTADDGKPGTGLGLSLVEELVKLYGGTVLLESKLNVGTTVSITLPVAEGKFPASSFVASTNNINASLQSHDNNISIDAPTDSESGSDLKAFQQDVILVVEDNEDLRRFISSTLSERFITLTAKDGEEGLAIAIHRIPSLIIADVMMPNLDGFGLAEKIKSDERTCHIPIVLLTAKADLESRITGLQTGADDYLAKPFSTAELNVRVTNLIEQRKRLAAKYTATLTGAVTNREPSLDEKFLQRAKSIVEENIGNSGFGVEQMAREIYLSRAQLFRKLKAITGLSPKEFINDIRLQRAAALILAKADTVSQIGYSVGYNEQSYFAKRFRKKFGVAPSEYSSKK
jgi:signal transduction histidine kinase/DNA-binding response OmpR family regulator